MKTTIELPDELFIAAKKRAAETRVTLKEIFERSLRRELHRAAKPKRTKRRPIRWVTAKGGLPPGMDVLDLRGWGIPLPCIAEFWSVVTHPASSGGPSSARSVSEFLKELIQSAGGIIWLPREAFWEHLVRAAADLRVQGARIFDLQIALTAFQNGATEIWTHDAGFVSLPGLTLHDPL